MCRGSETQLQVGDNSEGCADSQSNGVDKHSGNVFDRSVYKKNLYEYNYAYYIRNLYSKLGYDILSSRYLTLVLLN